MPDFMSFYIFEFKFCIYDFTYTYRYKYEVISSKFFSFFRFLWRAFTTFNVRYAKSHTMEVQKIQYYSFPYLCAATPILSKLRDPKNDDVKIANASTNGWQRRRGPMNLRRNINHPLDTTPRQLLLPRDNVNMTVSYLCGFLFYYY